MKLLVPGCLLWLVLSGCGDEMPSLPEVQTLPVASLQAPATPAEPEPPLPPWMTWIDSFWELACLSPGEWQALAVVMQYVEYAYHPQIEWRLMRVETSAEGYEVWLFISQTQPDGEVFTFTGSEHWFTVSRQFLIEEIRGQYGSLIYSRSGRSSGFQGQFPADTLIPLPPGKIPLPE